ncbi:MAG: serine/threonine protein kinase [Nannocystaceae bacterium]|nr:serine/threonine protein kinase [Nannocystaceae bacterium]
MTDAALPSPPPPSLAPLELERLRGAVRAGLFSTPAELPRLGRYTLLRCIGHGGMGIVYVARDEELGREVAIKLLRAEIGGGDERRLAHEARALAKLSHPNVVTVFDVGEHEGRRFIAMEYVVGQDLRRWLDAPRPLREVLRMFVAAGRGLQAAHAVGLVHRDFKPDNVLVGDDGRPRVLDFGLARGPDAALTGSARPPSLPTGIDALATTFTSAGALIGTPAYMAPEQYLGEPADARTDQFAFAVSLYHAVWGERPFAGDDAHQLALAIVRGRVRPGQPRYPVPAWLEAALARALRVDPGGRFEDMTAMLAAIEAGLEQPGQPELDALPVRGMGGGGRGGAVVVHDEGALESLHSLDTPGGSRGAAALVPAPSSTPAPAVATPPELHESGAVTQLTARRSLPGVVSEAALERMTRELDRLERVRGRVARLGTGLTWTTEALELHVDVDERGTNLLLWRRLGGALRRRFLRSGIAGFFAGALAIPIAEGLGWMRGGHDAAVVLGLLIGGAWLGVHAARRRAQAALAGERAQLEFVADRVAQLARGRELPLPSGG